MQTRLDTVIDNFREYLRSIKISTLSDKVEVDYTPLAYDYIDKDLDFDEAYYSGLCNSFQKWLETTAIDMIRECECLEVQITRNHMLFRNENIHVETTSLKLISSEQPYISVTREKRIKI